MTVIVLHPVTSLSVMSVAKLLKRCFKILYIILSCLVDVKTFGIADLDKQKEQINGICVLFIIVAVTSFISQFLQVSFKYQ